jgi:hypothetical protein
VKAFMAGYRVNQIIITTSSVLPWKNMLNASLYVADEFRHRGTDCATAGSAEDSVSPTMFLELCPMSVL